MKRNTTGTVNSIPSQMDDNEDDDEIETIQQQPIIKKNKSKDKKKIRSNYNNFNSSI